MADIKIPKQLFMELCKYHLYGPEAADQDYINTQLAAKLDKLVRHDQYSALITDKTPVLHGGRTVDKED